MSKLKVCLRHISEVFLYEFYCLGDDEYEISDEDTLTPHKEKAKEQLLAGNYSVAQQEWFMILLLIKRLEKELNPLNQGKD